MINPEKFELRHASGPVADRVKSWFLGQYQPDPNDPPVKEGDRTIHLPHPERPDMRIKLKGAGYRGGPVNLGQKHIADNPHPVFDFDGRMMEDRAASHSGAWQGGMTFQQAFAEYTVTKELEEMGVPTVSCLGYGRIANDKAESWFTIHEAGRDWVKNRLPYVSQERTGEAALLCGQITKRLALERNLLGYSWVTGAAEGQLYAKDLHPFRRADPFNMSRIAWTMHVIHGTHIPCFAIIFFANLSKETLRNDLQAYPFRAWLPTATAEQHDLLRFRIVGPYMRGTPSEFDPLKLREQILANPISRAIYEACPEDYPQN